jgi:hypothetical protein
MAATKPSPTPWPDAGTGRAGSGAGRGHRASALDPGHPARSATAKRSRRGKSSNTNANGTKIHNWRMLYRRNPASSRTRQARCAVQRGDAAPRHARPAGGSSAPPQSFTSRRPDHPGPEAASTITIPDGTITTTPATNSIRMILRRRGAPDSYHALGVEPSSSTPLWRRRLAGDARRVRMGLVIRP